MKKLTTPILILLAVLLISGGAWAGPISGTKAGIPPGTTRSDGSEHQNADTLSWSASLYRWVAGAPAGGGAWGSITGTLAGQTDLITYLGGSLTGKANYIPAVNAGGTAFTLVTVPQVSGVATNFLDGTGTYRNLASTDLPASYTAPASTLWGAYAAIAGPSQARTMTLPDANTTLAGLGTTQTLTATRVNPRISTLPSDDATLTSGNAEYNVDIADEFLILALAQATDFAVPGGTPVQGQKLTIRIKDDATAHALTWNAVFVPVGVVLPATTVISKLLYVGMIYNATAPQWDVVAVSQE